MRMRVIAIFLYMLSVIIGLATWFIPFNLQGNPLAPTDLDSTINTHVALSISLIYTFMQVLAAGLFFAGLRNFKAELKRPYSILCAGLIAFALAQLQAPIAVVFGAYWWLNSGLVLVLFVAPAVLIYGGIRLFARLVEIKGRLTLFRFALPLVLIPTALSFLVPVKLSLLAPTLEAAHFFLALPLWQAGWIGLSAYLVWQIKQAMGDAYTNAMRWLFVTLLAYAATNVHFVLLPYIPGFNTSWYGQSGAYLGLFIILSTMFVVSGYKFWRIGASQEEVQNASALDVIIYTASLATNKSEIDPILDDVRNLTARLIPGQSLSPDQERILGKVYLGLEEYLTTREPLRKLTQADLRESLGKQFPHDPTSPFWDSIQHGSQQQTAAQSLI